MDVNPRAERLSTQKSLNDLESRLTTEPKEQIRPKLDVNKQQIRFAAYETMKHKNLHKIQQSMKKPQQAQIRTSVNDSQFLQRSQAQLLQKQEQLKVAQEQAFQQQVAKELDGVTFHPQLSRYVQEKFKDRKRTGAEIYETGMSWLKERAQVVEQQREKILEVTNAAPFKPQVNKATNIKGDFYQRLAEKEEQKREKLAKLTKDNTPSFKPKINSTHCPLYASKSSVSKEQILLRHKPSAFDQLRKMTEKENLSRCDMNQFETKDQSFGETSQMSVNNSFVSLVKNMKQKHEPILQTGICSILKRPFHKQSQTLSSESNHLSTSFTLKPHSVQSDDMLSQSFNHDPKLPSPHFNIQATIKKQQKPLEDLFAQPAEDISEMMYDYLTSGFEDEL